MLLGGSEYPTRLGAKSIKHHRYAKGEQHLDRTYNKQSRDGDMFDIVHVGITQRGRTFYTFIFPRIFFHAAASRSASSIRGRVSRDSDALLPDPAAAPALPKAAADQLQLDTIAVVASVTLPEPTPPRPPW